MRNRSILLANFSQAGICRATIVAATLLLVMPASTPAAAQAGRSNVDVLTFKNGDQLRGKVLSESGGSVVFQSDMEGKITVPWSSIKELHTADRFAVITKGEKLRQGRPAHVPVGPVTFSSSDIAVAEKEGEVKNIPAADTAYVVNGAEFEKLLHHEPSFREGWKGSGTLAAAFVEATQTSKTVAGAINLVKTVPGADWLVPRNKTLIDGSVSYGSVSQPAVGTTPASSAHTNILHGGLEHDWYLSPRFYALADTSFDHNTGSGLKLQDTFGGGAGYSVIQRPMETFDVKGDIHFEHQDFYPAGPDIPGVSLNLVGVNLGEIYMRKLAHGMVFNESGLVQPAFNHPSAFTAQLIAGLVFPVYKNFGFSLGTQDNYINNPPSGYKSNTFQFTAGMNYTFQ